MTQHSHLDPSAFLLDGGPIGVLLIHGFTGRLEVWKEHGVLEALVRDFRVIALDCRGHGKSDKPHDPEMYGAEMAEDVVRVLDHLNLKKAHVVGYSMGARLTGYLLAKKADRLITATFGGSPPRLSFSQEEERARRAIARIQERGLTADGSDGQDYVALAAVRGSWRKQVVRESQLAGTSIPALAIVGSEDSRLPGMKSLTDIIPALKLVIIDGATHGGERGALGRAEFVRAVHDFISSNHEE